MPKMIATPLSAGKDDRLDITLWLEEKLHIEGPLSEISEPRQTELRAQYISDRAWRRRKI
jgi:hypothetical protein